MYNNDEQEILNSDYILYLNGNHTDNGFIALGCDKEIIISEEPVDFDILEDFISLPNQWKFGFISYDIKNDTEKLTSQNFDGLGFPKIHFFIPQTLIKVKGKDLQLIYGDNSLLQACENYFFNVNEKKHESISLFPRIKKDAYLSKITKVKEHIQLGDIYEMNFCYEFYNDSAEINPIEIYNKLNELTLAPFSCFAKFNDKFILSASPERYIKKSQNKLVSQPIKGTITRGQNVLEDEQLIKELKNNPKERSENIMIVDLVRNDLSKIATKSSVNVDELCGIYTFETVHQMISTISCEIKPNTSFSEIVKATFPMGSMTGAPKIRAMELIEQFETTKRGVYSGAVGYITPEGDFDLNVIIRTLLYNSTNNYLSCMVGGAITANSDEENEYEETLLKARALLKALK